MKASCAQSFAMSVSPVIRSAMLNTRPPYRSTRVAYAFASPARHALTTSWSVSVRVPPPPWPGDRVIGSTRPAGAVFRYSRALHGPDLAWPRLFPYARAGGDRADRPARPQVWARHTQDRGCDRDDLARAPWPFEPQVGGR